MVVIPDISNFSEKKEGAYFLKEFEIEFCFLFFVP
jgi:hypothetical protein